MTLHLPRPLPLALALSLAFGAGPLWAQAAPEPAAAATREIRIAAQPLGDALNAWARQTQMQMAVQHALVAGKTAPAVAGQLTPRQALDRLLQGSGLVANVQGKDLDLQLNVNNLFDKYYYRAVASPVHGNLFGNPRNAQLTARYQF